MNHRWIVWVAMSSACVGAALTFGRAGASPSAVSDPRIGLPLSARAAGGPTCATPEPDPGLRARVEAQTHQILGRRGSLAAVRRPGTVTVPVWFHVVTSADGTQGVVTDTQIADQIAFLNQAFSGQDTKAPGQLDSAQKSANTPFRFVLAGITRTASDDWFEQSQGSAAEDAMKAALRQGDAKTLNIYSVRTTGSVSGYATFPWNYAANPVRDGVVVWYTCLSGGGAVSGPFRHDLGDTAAHEAGHWLGLYHTFQGGCEKNNDYVSDTPAEATYFYGPLPPYPDSCTGSAFKGRDPVENFMDYTPGIYKYQFTAGQSARMDSMALTHRGL